MRSLLRTLPLLLLVLAACDSNEDEADKACYSRSSGRVCFAYTDTVVGTGAAPAPGDSVFVRYVGRVQGNGNAEFDRGAFGFPLRDGQVIPGFYYAIAGGTLEGIADIPPMLVGGKRTATVPAELAYGNREFRNAQGYVLIPRNSDLVFEIELTGVKTR